MSYALLAFLGTILAFAGGLWYLVRKGGADASTIVALTTQAQAEQARVKAVEAQVLEAESALREAEKKRNDKIAADHDADAAGGLLARTPGDHDLN